VEYVKCDDGEMGCCMKKRKCRQLSGRDKQINQKRIIDIETLGATRSEIDNEKEIDGRWALR
jgi:hypothetical protein